MNDNQDEGIKGNYPQHIGTLSELPYGVPKLVLLDIDGTLVNKELKINPEIPKIICSLQEKGVLFGFATGRPLFGALEVGKIIPVKAPSMFFSGSLVTQGCDSKTVIFEKYVDTKIVQEVIKEARKRGIYFEVYTKDAFYVDNLEHPFVELHKTYLQVAPKGGDTPSVNEIIIQQPILKILLAGEENKRSILDCRELVGKYANLHSGEGRGAQHPQILFFNLTSLEAVRTNALHAIVEGLGIKLTEISSFGDSQADREIIDQVGFGVVMGNATPDVLQGAKYVTDSVEGEGVLPALRLMLRQCS